LSAPESAARRSKPKKKALASEAERLAVGTGGLLLMLRAVEPEAQGDVTRSLIRAGKREARQVAHLGYF
jgi:hypothetical protein